VAPIVAGCWLGMAKPAHLSSFAKPKEKKRKEKDYTFRRQLNEKPSIIPGCPGPNQNMIC